MRLVPFAVELAPAVASWSTGRSETVAWCGLDEVDARTVASWSEPPDVDAFVATVDDVAVAYGELWHDADEAELAHLIVRPGDRRWGVGRRFVEALAVEALVRHPVASLRVVPENHAAVRCYLAAGFVRASPDEERAWNAGQPRAYEWLVRTRDR